MGGRLIGINREDNRRVNQLSSILLLMIITAGIDIGHLVKTIVSLAASTWYMYSDVNLGLYHYYPKNVTRYMENSTVTSENCVSRFDSNSTGLFECLEEDRTSATITFTFIFLPSLSFALEVAGGLLGIAWHMALMKMERKGCCYSFFSFWFLFQSSCLPNMWRVSS